MEQRPKVCFCRRLQGLGKVKMVFDVEKIKTESHAFARNITSAVYIVQVHPLP